MPINLRPIAYGTGLTLSTDGKLRIRPIDTVRDLEIVICQKRGPDWYVLNYDGSGLHLTRSGAWQHQDYHIYEELMPRCRYASLDEAREWLERVMEGQNG